MIAEQLQTNYAEKGYVLLRGIIDPRGIDELLRNFLGLVEQIAGRRFEDAHSTEIATFLKEHKDIQGAVYNEIRRPSLLTQFSMQRGLVDCVRQLLGNAIALHQKIPFRIDVPLDTTEYAVWHQDFHYVRGNSEIVTAWIPMQDTTYFNGCLAVMPGSHRLGPLVHDKTVLKKRHYPSKVFDREVRYVEMRKGDALLFHSWLLHSSSLNLSPEIRYSLQPRYTKSGAPTDPSMGDILPISG